MSVQFTEGEEYRVTVEHTFAGVYCGQATVRGQTFDVFDTDPGPPGQFSGSGKRRLLRRAIKRAEKVE